MKTSAMKNPFRHDRAFRIAFVLLVAVAALVLLWQCGQMPRGPSRVDWPASSTGTKKP